MASKTPTERNVCTYIVCLIDLLGQEQELKKWNVPPYNSPECKKAFRDSVGRVEFLRNKFRETFQQFEASTTSVGSAHADTEDVVQAFRRVSNCDLRESHFSDTLVFYSPVFNSHNDLSATGLFRMLGAATSVMLNALEREWPMRGGVSLGAGTELGMGDLYGFALAHAHHLESKIAEYPRIVVSTDIRDYLGHILSQDDAGGPHILGAKFYAEMCKLFIDEDDDGQLILDHLGKGSHKLLDIPGPRPPIEKIHAFAKSEAARFEAAEDKTLGPRYRQLQQYVESRLSVWQHSPSSGE